MKKLIFLFLIFSITLLPLKGDYYSYKKGSKWQDFYGYHGWKSVYGYEGWKRVYKYENWRDVYGYSSWREVYLKKEYRYPFRTRVPRPRNLAPTKFLFISGFFLCIP